MLICYMQNNGQLEQNVFFIWLHQIFLLIVKSEWLQKKSLKSVLDLW